MAPLLNGSTRAVRHLVLWLTTACNLSCVYCYRGKPEASERMSRATALAALELAARSGQPFKVQLAGGEPTLEPGLIETVAREARRQGWPATVAVQTNGVAVDRAMAGLFKRWGIAVGVSLDGPPSVQERLRGRAADTWRGLEELNRAGLDFGVTAVVSGDNLTELPRLALLLGRWPHARGLGLDLLVRRGRAHGGGTAMAQPAALSETMQELAAAVAWVSQRRSRPLVLREQQRLRNPMLPFCQAALGAALAVHPDGRLYPCGQSMGDEELSLGTLARPDFSRAAAMASYSLPNQDCGGCPLQGRCPGECPSRLKYNGPQGRALACAMWRGLASSPEMAAARRAGSEERSHAAA